MLDAMQTVETPLIPPDASIADLCRLLIECEKMQHRYQWSSGVVIVAMMRHQGGKKFPDFVEWLNRQTGLPLSQSEVRRRVDVFQFYSKFSDNQIIGLVENGGLKVALRARRVISHDPEQARTVLQACVDNPGAVDEVLQKFGEKRYRTRKANAPRFTRAQINQLESKLHESVYRFAGKDWVPLSLIREFLDQSPGR